MSDQNFSKQQGVKALKKYDMKVSSIVFMIYCLVAAGAFGIEEMIPASGPGMTLLMLIIFPVIWAFPISNLVAECGSLLPSEGGFGDSVGYASVLTENMGAAWGYAFLFIAIISQCAIFNTYLASGSRGFFVLADDRLFPQFMVKVSQKKGVPYVGILTLSAVTMFLAQ